MKRIDLDMTKLLGFRLTGGDAGDAATSAKIGQKVGSKVGLKAAK